MTDQSNEAPVQPNKGIAKAGTAGGSIGLSLYLYPYFYAWLQHRYGIDEGFAKFLAASFLSGAGTFFTWLTPHSVLASTIAGIRWTKNAIKQIKDALHSNN